jgi:hypothetical protein
MPAKMISEKALLSNDSRYRLVGGTRQRHFAGTSLKPRNLLKNAQTPTSRVHAVLASMSFGKRCYYIKHIWTCGFQDLQKF